MNILVTKAATAHVEIEADTPVVVPIAHLVNIRSAPAEAEIGASILYFLDGTTLNVVESNSSLRSMVNHSLQHYFEFNFSKN